MYQNPPGVLSVIVIDPDIEQRIMDSLKQDEHSIRSVLDPETVTNIMNEIREEAKRVSLQGYTPIVLCLAPVRLHLAQIAERIKSNIVVLSYEEITQEAKIEPIGMIRLRLKQNQGR